ncbi:hypothetical protein [Luteitalea sp. TBR-22]|uniref:hypothetical protein n=1 Tax=Luteitalea sp. TBR-22 TaxID=2802971 RepID=UPI001EF6ABD1|nr:hypothetical protein [Luteitalea sp. TBR-22]
MIQWGTRVAMALLGSGLMVAAGATAQPAAGGGTAAIARELSAALASQGAPGAPRFIAAEDPKDPTRFVAAMLLPDLQLMVVSAAYKAPVLLRERVLTRKYQEAYQDLHAASVPEGKVVIEDLLANGLAVKPARNQAPDVATIGGRTVSFDGQWRKARIPEAEYTAAFASAEQEYTRLLGLLVAQAKVK